MLVFLEDTSLLAEKVQQSKLAALGRLSASIAHEIRTPIGAMSHAGQLLAESPAIAPEDRRLTQIIRDNAERVSRIVENVLELSRRSARRPERIELASWINEFWAEFCATQQVVRGAAAHRGLLPTKAANIEVRVDPTQLHQVMWNLCQNALTHGADRGPGQRRRADPLWPHLPAMAVPSWKWPTRGPGIADEDIERVFEPFFTKAPRGHGPRPVPGARTGAGQWRHAAA